MRAYPDLTQFRLIFGGAYLVVAFLAWRVPVKNNDGERRLWTAMAATLILFGIAKASNAEESLLDVVRSASQREHLYGWHKVFQAAWLMFALALAAVWTVRVLARLRSVGTRTVIALISFALLTVFIAIRLASIHLVDIWVTIPILAIRAGWWFELIALTVIAAAATAPRADRASAAQSLGGADRQA